MSTQDKGSQELYSQLIFEGKNINDHNLQNFKSMYFQCTVLTGTVSRHNKPGNENIYCCQK